jgi:hypothetical protein
LFFNKEREREREREKSLVVLSFVAVLKKSLPANAIDRTTPTLERTQAHGQQAIAPANDPSRTCTQAHRTLAIDRTLPTLERTSKDQPQ